MDIRGNTLVKGLNKPHVVIPEGVEIIGPKAFDYCFDLTSVKLPSTLTSIGANAFNMCSDLTSIDFSNTSLTSIGTDAFAWCKGLTSVDLSQTSLTSIEPGTFRRGSQLTSVALPSSLTSIGRSAFKNCKRLTSIELPSNLTSIGENAFEYTNLIHIELPSTLTSIGECAFRSCFVLGNRHTVDLSQTRLTSIKRSVFENCTRLHGIKLPSTVTSIEEYAFRGCALLTIVELPSTLTKIENQAFEDCSGLFNIELPSSLTSIGDKAFGDCSRLTIIVPPQQNPGGCQIHPEAFTGCLRVLNASGQPIPNSIVLDSSIIGLRQRLLALWSQNVRRQGLLRQTGKSFDDFLSENGEGSETKTSLRERDEVFKIWTQIKAVLDYKMHYTAPHLFRKIMEGGRKLVRMKSYLNQPKNTKVFQQVLEDLGITEPRRFRNWEGRLVSQLRL